MIASCLQGEESVYFAPVLKISLSWIRLFFAVVDPKVIQSSVGMRLSNMLALLNLID